MKGLWRWAFVGLIIFSILKAINQASVCDKPLKYSIGNFDHRFGISEQQFRNTILRVERVWEEPMGINLFDYEPSAEFKVNLVFDERQADTILARKLEGKLDNLESSYDSVETEYKARSSLYDRESIAYDATKASLKRRTSSLNSRVTYWNENGDVSEYTYNELQREQRSIELATAELERKRVELNAFVDKINALAKRSDNLAYNYNTTATTYNSKFGAEKEFDQGSYNGDEINVYQFNEIPDLNLILTHELGHALNLDHVENPSSIMYYLMDEQNLNSLSLTQEDIQALKAECNLN